MIRVVAALSVVLGALALAGCGGGGGGSKDSAKDTAATDKTPVTLTFWSPFTARAYGLYYNQALLPKAGITAPPKTVDELAADAKKLTTRNHDGSLKVVGFDPLMGWYENAPVHWGPMWGATWMNGDKSGLT